MPNDKRFRPGLALGAFTLIELLASMVVLALLVVLVSQMVDSASKVTVGNTKHLDADEQSRIVFERLGLDLAKMVERADADCLFAKLPLQVSAGSGHDDKMFFYSEVPAYFDGNSAQLSSASPVSLVGYRINAGFQLERLGKLLTWDGTPQPSAAPGGIMFLSSPTAALNPDPASTLAGNWPNTIGSTTDSPPYSVTTDDGDYNVLAEQVFRFEVCYLLQPVAHIDPSTGNLTYVSKYSSLPVANPDFPGAAVTPTHNNLTATRPPAATDDVGSPANPTYLAGSRWYDNTNSRAYVCTNNALGAAVWKILGMQDVAGIVVAIAVLDGTTGKILPTMQVQLSSTQTQPSTVPNLTSLNALFADLSNDQAAAGPTAPDLSLSPPRLMAEAWQNELSQPNFAQLAGGVPQQVVSQIRIYQRYLPLHNSQ